MTRHRKAESGLTLVELLAVIAVIAILAALFFPVLGNARDKASRTICMNNLRQINPGLRMYSDDSNDKAPRAPGTANSPGLNWSGYKDLMKSYVGGVVIGAGQAVCLPSTLKIRRSGRAGLRRAGPFAILAS
jgi:prepilin-type N-terminal cleavage/methylation domain-containing protein